MNKKLKFSKFIPDQYKYVVLGLMGSHFKPELVKENG